MNFGCIVKIGAGGPFVLIMNTEHETDAARRARVQVAHRKALRELARMTARYQVFNELAAARLALVVVGAVVLSACGGAVDGAPDVATNGELELDAGAPVDGAPDVAKGYPCFAVAVGAFGCCCAHLPDGGATMDE